MQVIEKDSVIVLERFTRDEKVHINKLPPTTLSPDGYELPSMEEFNRLFDATDYIWMMYNGTHILRNPWNGHSTVKRQQLRKNGIQVGSMTISNLIYIALSSPDFPEHEPLVWYGPAAQWNDTGILHSGHYNNILFGVYSPHRRGVVYERRHGQPLHDQKRSQQLRHPNPAIQEVGRRIYLLIHYAISIYTRRDKRSWLFRLSLRVYTTENIRNIKRLLLPNAGLYGIHGILIIVSYFTNRKLSRPLRHFILE